MTFEHIVSGSFRDPSGFVFMRDGVLYRQVNAGYRVHYDRMLQSGLYDALVRDRVLLAHETVNLALPVPAEPGPTLTHSQAYLIIKPEFVPCISYPYEWSFSQLQDAALTTLRIQQRALEFGMILKDASAYNLQFRGCDPVLIDTLSFETYQEGRPWPAYRQFCQHFLAPLALMSYVDVRLGQLSRNYVDGIPLDLASRLLPRVSCLNLSLLMHLHLHARAQRTHAPATAKTARQPPVRPVTRPALLGLLENLIGAVRRLRWKPDGTTWSDYYDNTNYSPSALNQKLSLVCRLLNAVTPAPRTAWDLGANDGSFSRLLTARDITTVAWDMDPAVIEQNYLRSRQGQDPHMLPLLQDFTNPSPALGWAGSERESLLERGPVDVALALALVHHLALGNNLPLEHLAQWFSRLCRWLIIEFVPKTDSQAQRLLASREDIFATYTTGHFVSAFARHFSLISSHEIPGTQRTLYLWKRRS